ncbi:hypoxanthine phosphoribosyltransferase [Methylophilaceae bacterium]|nr:hypoxanthine phosphoribosyltransferase [Methylophilaceae bacterium]
MTDSIDPEQILDRAEEIYGAHQVDSAITRLAEEVNAALGDTVPLVICVMGGAVFFAGQLLPKLRFPLEFDYVQVSRYHNRTEGQSLVWKVVPGENVRNRTVLVLDDILDEGHTLAAIKARCLELGAARVLTGVLVEKELAVEKPVSADFIGLKVPNRYVFGCGMDVYGWWRNLPAIYALV